MLETRLADRDWVMGDEITIADIAMLGWVRVLNTFYAAADVLGLGILPEDDGLGRAHDGPAGC